MVRKLPTTKYKGKKCVVDFRLEELRCTKKGGREIETIPFRKIPGDPKKSKIKKRLRGIRFRSGPNIFFDGIDN